MDDGANFYIVDKFEIFTACTLSAYTLLDVTYSYPRPLCISMVEHIQEDVTINPIIQAYKFWLSKI